MAELILYPKVEKFLNDLNDESRAKVVIMIDLLEECGHMLREPYSKKLTKNIFELRARGKQEVRLLFCYKGDKVHILTGFIKKTQKTPRTEILRAEKEFANLDI